MSTPSSTRFPEGTFAPNPGSAPMLKVLIAQTRMELALILRHGEQALLSMVIPLAMLVGFTVVPVLEMDDPLATVYPMVLAVSAMSAGFTGLAIAVGFDRRYGALKRVGASGLPRWAIIAGKTLAVAGVVTIQFGLMTATAIALGYREHVGLVLLAFVVTLLGAAAFAAMGLLMGGTLAAELILALANLIWFVLLGAATLVAVGPELPDAATTALSLLPSVALTQALIGVLGDGVVWPYLLVMVAWGALCAVLATKLFSFDSPQD
ncbi:ABC transporter permease [Corynebacterium sp. TAE3-ERU12]|uniref:ABC transporter permease n=1 Tax=Corynebacterium sp. TAE3-ERU12 TaxID=2849491 RepID=UPI001C48CD97|nr:ABC transporter permease [Corynebacterium sp. TAE3-ERU12]MBV7295423.1 ABC transporter permease [Corynebacterium sp. TAE3-ERU12]